MLGKKVGGRYEILDRVGGGGMAVVYKAKDSLLGRIVALKVLRPQYAIDDDFVHRFRREAQAAASLSHPNIVSIFDVGVEDDIHYIVMEYVDGLTLKKYITSNAPLDVKEAIYITRQIAEALEHAHQNHTIHRDIKPHNILLGNNLQIKVTDFGIARAATSSTITHAGSVIGSVHYFSPEHAKGGVAGEKSDIYSLGVVLYEMLTGELPFSGESPISVALQHLRASFTEPRSINKDIPQSVENIILRSMAKDPLQRYASAKELIKDLDTCLLPERLNEEKVNIFDEDYDEQSTKVVSVIRDDMYDTKVVTSKEQQNMKTREEAYVKEDNDEEDDDERSSSSIRWLKPLISVVIIVLFTLGAYLGVKAIYESLFTIDEIILSDVRHKELDEAVKILEGQGLQVVDIREVNDDEVPEGYVISQSPEAETAVRENSLVRLTVSKGKPKIEMYDLTNMEQKKAEQLLDSFAEVKIVEEASDEVSEDFVIRHEPSPEEMVVPSETTVTLYVSTGPDTIQMPDLIGKTREEAEAIIQQSGLELGDVRSGHSDEYESGLVYQQFPADPEQEVAVGTEITIWISEGPSVREKVETFFIALKEGETARITIIISDVDGEHEFVNEVIDKSEIFEVPVKVTRAQDATITVYKNGLTYEGPVTITYEDL